MKAKKPRLALIVGALCATLGASSLMTPALAQEINGRASVIDADTIEIHGQRIRFHGIDAPESKQRCEANGVLWRCGQQAALALADKIGQMPVSCEETDIDRYKRIVAICRLNGEDLNGWLVEQGWAIAYRRYSKAYIPHEQRAEHAKIGIWRGPFVLPWEWRRGKRLPSE